MPDNPTDNQLLDRYLSGAITAPEEAQLERRALADPVLADALYALNVFPAEDHAARVAGILKGARTQVRAKDKGARRRPLYRYAAVAVVALLLIAAVFLLPRLTDNAAPDLAMDTPPPAAAPVPAAAEAATKNAAPRPVKREPSPASAPASPAPVPLPIKKETDTSVVAEAQAPPPPDDPLESLPARRESAEPSGLSPSAVAAAESNVAPRQRRQRTSADPPNGALADNGVRKKRGGEITGTITDDNGRPIPDVLVRLPGLPLGERTDSNGVFVFAADATTSRLEFSHPDYRSESLAVDPRRDAIQLTLENRKVEPSDRKASWSGITIRMDDDLPGQARPEEGYGELRRRIEAGKPGEVPTGKVRLSFLVNPDGTLEDFIFRGNPSRETMDYIGETIMQASIWRVTQGSKPVRVYFKVVFE